MSIPQRQKLSNPGGLIYRQTFIARPHQRVAYCVGSRPFTQYATQGLVGASHGPALSLPYGMTSGTVNTSAGVPSVSSVSCGPSRRKPLTARNSSRNCCS